MAEYDRLFKEDDPNFAELHRHLVANFDFPLSRHALDDLFIRTGQHVPSTHPKAVGKTGVRMTAEWRRVVDREYEAARGKPGSWSGFLRRLQDQHQFPFTERTLVKYLKNKGGQAFEDEHQYWMKVIIETARETRPTKLEPFYRELVERYGCPLAPATVWDYLHKKAGISMTQNAREQREKFTAIIVRGGAGRPAARSFIVRWSRSSDFLTATPPCASSSSGPESRSRTSAGSAKPHSASCPTEEALFAPSRTSPTPEARAQPRGTSAPAAGELFQAHAVEFACAETDIDHRLPSRSMTGPMDKSSGRIARSKRSPCAAITWGR